MTGFEQRFFGLLAIGDVAQDDHAAEDVASPIPKSGNTQVNDMQRVVASQGHPAIFASLVSQDWFQFRPGVFQRAANSLWLSFAHQPFGSRIHVHNPVVFIHNDNAVANAAEDGPATYGEYITLAEGR